MVILNFKMVNEQQSIQTSLLVIIIITLEMFFVGNIIPVRALHKEQQLLENYDDLQEFADAVKNGDEEIEDIPLESMKASNIYDDADESLQDCIDLAAKIGDNIADKDVVHCVEDVDYFKNKLSSNSSVPTTQTSTTDIGTSAATGTNGTSTSNGISTADDEENNLINELVKTGKFTEDEAKEFNLIHELVKTGKFTEDEAKEFVTKAMNNGTNEANVPAEAKAPEPEPNVTTNVPEANVPQDNNSDLVKLDISVKQNPIAPGEEQTVTLIASDPSTGEPLERIFVHLTIKDPSGNVVKDFTDNDGRLSPTFMISENAVGTFTILGTALQAGVESSKSLTFQVQ